MTKLINYLFGGQITENKVSFKYNFNFNKASIPLPVSSNQI